MEGNCINWLELKKDYSGWRSRLWEETQRVLTCSDKVELSQYNQVGYFHKVHRQSEFERMQQEWEQLRRVPHEWISKGIFPGIWTAMFNPSNTFSIAVLPIRIVRFYFKREYFIFDVQNPSHERLLNRWLKKNKTIENPWKDLRNHRGESLEERMKFHGYPFHKKFFEDNNFGAIIGYSDYISAVIVLEDAIQEVEFSVLN